MTHAIMRGKNGRRYEVDLGDSPIRVEIHAALDCKIIATPVAPSPREPHRRAETSIAFLAAPLPRGTVGALPPDAISCIGAFRPPVARARG